MGHNSELIFSGSLTVHKAGYHVLDLLCFFLSSSSALI